MRFLVGCSAIFLTLALVQSRGKDDPNKVKPSVRSGKGCEHGNESLPHNSNRTDPNRCARLSCNNGALTITNCTADQNHPHNSAPSNGREFPDCCPEKPEGERSVLGVPNRDDPTPEQFQRL